MEFLETLEKRVTVQHEARRLWIETYQRTNCHVTADGAVLRFIEAARRIAKETEDLR